MARFDDSFAARRSRIDREFDEDCRRVRAHLRLIWALNIAGFAVAIAAAAWLLFHPEAIGDFFGRIAAGFGGRA